MVRGYYSIKAAEVKRLCVGHLASCIERVNRVEPPISANSTESGRSISGCGI